MIWRRCDESVSFMLMHKKCMLLCVQNIQNPIAIRTTSALTISIPFMRTWCIFQNINSCVIAYRLRPPDAPTTQLSAYAARPRDKCPRKIGTIMCTVHHLFVFHCQRPRQRRHVAIKSPSTLPSHTEFPKRSILFTRVCSALYVSSCVSFMLHLSLCLSLCASIIVTHLCAACVAAARDSRIDL